MTITVTELGTAYAALAQWTGQPVEEVRRQLEDDHERKHWLAWREAAVIGALHPWLAPDGRYRLHFDRTLPEAYPTLIEMVNGPSMTFIDAENTAAADALQALGFEVTRRELQVEIPIAHTEYAVPAGYRVISADDAEVRDLARLDAEIRDQVPGSGGWVTDEQWFRQQTFDSPYYDPATYLVAIDSADAYAGMTRIWNGPRPLPRLGMIGVHQDHRRRGLARALLSSAFNVLESRGNPTAIAEVDESNTASRTLLTSFGATTVAVELEMSRI